jgi:general secretion pathway protein D
MIQIIATSDPNTNTLVIKAPEHIQKQIKEMIEMIDRPQFAMNVEVIKIKYIPATDIANLLQQIINYKYKQSNGKCVGDLSTNKIIILEKQLHIDELKTIINKIDTKPNMSNSVFLKQIKNAKADNIQKILSGIR